MSALFFPSHLLASYTFNTPFGRSLDLCPSHYSSTLFISTVCCSFWPLCLCRTTRAIPRLPTSPISSISWQFVINPSFELLNLTNCFESSSYIVDSVSPIMGPHKLQIRGGKAHIVRIQSNAYLTPPWRTSDQVSSCMSSFDKILTCCLLIVLTHVSLSLQSWTVSGLVPLGAGLVNSLSSILSFLLLWACLPYAFPPSHSALWPSLCLHSSESVRWTLSSAVFQGSWQSWRLLATIGRGCSSMMPTGATKGRRPTPHAHYYGPGGGGADDAPTSPHW